MYSLIFIFFWKVCVSATLKYLQSPPGGFRASLGKHWIWPLIAVF